jgi:predicted membrane protein
MSAEKHPVRNSVFATVIGGLLLALLLWLIPGLWAWLVTVIAQSYNFMISTVIIPVWLLGVLILAILPTLILIIVLIVAMRKGQKLPEWLNYTTDYFDGMTWRWEYFENSVNNLRCYCPNDDTLLIHSRGYESITFHCETCRREFGPFKGDRDYILAKTERQIERKVRNGEWEKTLLRAKDAKS